MDNFMTNLKAHFEKLPVGEEEMQETIKKLKNEALLTFKTGILSGSDFLSTPKGEEFL